MREIDLRFFLFFVFVYFVFELRMPSEVNESNGQRMARYLITDQMEEERPVEGVLKSND